MSKHLPCLKIQSSGGRDFSNFLCRFFKAGGEDIKDIRLAFPQGFKRVYIFIEGRLGGRFKWVLGGLGLGLGSPNLVRARGSRGGGHCPRGRAAVPSVVSRFPASKTSPFLHALCTFNRGEFGQRDGIYIHGIWVMMGARGSIIVGRGSSLVKISNAN